MRPRSCRAPTRSRPVAALGVDAATATLLAPAPAPDDEFAEWDSAETIDAVARRALRLGEVDPPRGRRDDFPERLRAERPDIVFNIAEGLHGPNREAHVPAICEFFGIPYSGSDPFTLVALPRQGAHEGDARVPRRPDGAVLRCSTRGADDARARRDRARLATLSRCSRSRCTKDRPRESPERNFVRDADELRAIVVEFSSSATSSPCSSRTFLPGAEFTCGVLGNGPDARVLPHRRHELRFAARRARFRSMASRRSGSGTARRIRSRSSSARRGSTTSCAPRSRTSSFAPTACSAAATGRASTCGWMPTGVPNIVEVNPLPGILPDPADNSCLPKAAAPRGIDYDAAHSGCLRCRGAHGSRCATPACTRLGTQTHEDRDPLRRCVSASPTTPDQDDHRHRRSRSTDVARRRGKHGRSASRCIPDGSWIERAAPRQVRPRVQPVRGRSTASRRSSRR